MTDDETILERRCRIAPYRRRGDVELVISFARPVHKGDDVTASVTISSSHFSRTFTLEGVDELQAFAFTLDIAVIYLGEKAQEGYPIYVYEPGDLDLTNFWRCSVRDSPRRGGILAAIRRSPLIGANLDFARHTHPLPRAPS